MSTLRGLRGYSGGTPRGTLGCYTGHSTHTQGVLCVSTASVYNPLNTRYVPVAYPLYTPVVAREYQRELARALERAAREREVREDEHDEPAHTLHYDPREPIRHGITG